MDLLTLLTVKGIPYKEGSGGEITINCPFCIDRGESQDENFKLGLNVRRNEGHCFRCSWKARGYAIQALTKRLELEDVVDIPLGFVDDDEQKKIKVSLPEGFIKLSDKSETGYWMKAARAYMFDRHISWDQIERTGVGFTEIGKYAYRVVFPIYYKKRLRGLVGRDITGKREPKYLNSEGARTLFFSFKAKRKDLIVLSEGIFKCLALEKLLASDHCSTAALLGHTMTGLQEQQVEGYSRILLWPDPDTVGIKGMMDVGEQLSNHKVFVPWPAPERQADDYTLEELELFKITAFNEVMRMRYKLHASGLDE